MICRDAAFGIQGDAESLLKAMDDNEAILDDLEDKIQQSVNIANDVKKDVKQVSSSHVCGNNRNHTKTHINMDLSPASLRLRTRWFPPSRGLWVSQGCWVRFAPCWMS